MEKVKIYFLTKEDNIPFYVGKTKNPLQKRRSHHKCTYKCDIQLVVIDEVPDEEWKFWECYWIEQFKTWGFDLDNRNEGGGGPHNMSEETKEKMRGKVVTKKTRVKMSKSRIGHPMYTDEWREKISKSKKGKPNPKLRETITGKPKIKKSWIVEQFDLSSNYIKSFTSSKEAGEYLGRNPQSIRDAASGIQKTAYGYKWKYNKDIAIEN